MDGFKRWLILILEELGMINVLPFPAMPTSFKLSENLLGLFQVLSLNNIFVHSLIRKIPFVYYSVSLMRPTVILQTGLQQSLINKVVL